MPFQTWKTVAGAAEIIEEKMTASVLRKDTYTGYSTIVGT